MTARVGAGWAKPSAVTHHGRPGDIDIPSGGIDIGGGIAVVAEAGVGNGNNVHQLRHCHRFAPGQAAVTRLNHPDAVKRGEPRGTVPENVHRAIRTNHRARALAIKHVAHNQLWRAKGFAAIYRERKGDG